MMGISGVYTTANIADTYEDISGVQQWSMHLHPHDDCLDRSDWISEMGT